MTKTKIEWTDETWNPTTGCDKVSPGCDNCYALGMAARLKAMGSGRYQNDGDPRTSGPGFALTMHPDSLEQPLRWTRPRMIFVNSMSDLFHPDVTDEFIAEVFAVMSLAQDHTFQVLTKRPKRMRDLLNSPRFEQELMHDAIGAWVGWMDRNGKPIPLSDEYSWPCRNVWLGVSVETNRYAFRATVLQDTPAAVRFVSAEPLLGPLDQLDLEGIDWLIVGGESGTGARPMHPAWVRALQERCESCWFDTDGDGDCAICRPPAHVAMERALLAEPPFPHRTAFFFKQWGAWAPYTPEDWSEDAGGVTCVKRDGATSWCAGDDDSLTNHTANYDEDDHPVTRVGKKNAGRLLDGRTYDEMPR